VDFPEPSLLDNKVPVDRARSSKHGQRRRSQKVRETESQVDTREDDGGAAAMPNPGALVFSFHVSAHPRVLFLTGVGPLCCMKWVRGG
jgi:hypothetical protein